MEIPETRTCTQCGHEKRLQTEFRNQRNGKYGKQSACKDCVKKQLKEYRQTPEGKKKHRAYQAKHRAKPGYLEKHGSYRKKPCALWKAYQRGAEKRGIGFELTEFEFAALCTQKCHYCGGLDDINGVDRVDNAVGYTSGNCVPCCSPCNFMKGTMSAEEFVRRCESIAALHERSWKGTGRCGRI